MTIKNLENQYKGLTLDNSCDFISAIRSASSDKEITSLSLIAFLNRTVTDFIPEGERISNSVESLAEDEKSRIIIHGKIMVALMKILLKTHSLRDLRKTMLLFLEYSACLSDGQLKLTETAKL